jgi:hypothetical protein
MLKSDDKKSDAFCEATIDTILEKNARTINTEAPATSNVGAAGQRSGLSSFTNVTFNAGAAGEKSVSLNDPNFWDLIGLEDARVKAKPKSATKRVHKKLYDLSRLGGRGDDTGGDADWGGIDSAVSDDDHDGEDEEGAPKRRARRSAAAMTLDELVDVWEVDDDAKEKYYDLAWSQRQRDRFLQALHRYGWHRMAELLPYFPNQTLRDMEHLALSYIVTLYTRANEKMKKPTASTLLGAIRQTLLRHLQEQWEKKHAAGAAASDTHASPVLSLELQLLSKTRSPQLQLPLPLPLLPSCLLFPHPTRWTRRVTSVCP